MMRVRRVRKPFRCDADYTQLFFFDKHYALSLLYCQQIQYSGQLAIPRMVGSLCPTEEENDGEAHAAYKLMLFSRMRCPGPGGCVDPGMVRGHQSRRAVQHVLRITARLEGGCREKPALGGAWPPGPPQTNC